ncbi:endonuclease/exonuclease/phosphatase family protein [Leptolyngbya iicbica]|uniref:Endonuclease/exonuclease/phosphatase family protein n=2 Tax=Cyanophyceae TaxID=3028117 RepID=A0A4Q7E4L2_9CYAN|nr:endonuclease/exonuclease/phosphatase family protein [Leptolyngbya sp. LK]RZM76654.1 endonuclease/exonuclease/phosphatase family protein [Leptolyngbya sp. LK]
MSSFSDLCSQLWPFDAAARLNPFSPSFEAVIEGHQFSRTVLDPASIAIANWNIAKNNHLDEWLTEAEAIAQRYDPDLFFLQEVRIASPEQAPVPFAEHGWHFAPNLRDARTRHAFGVLTAAKVQHLDHQHLHTQHYEPVFNTPKVALITEYPLMTRGQSLVTVNVHGLNFVDNGKFQAQLQQLADHIQHHAGPMIVAGDFNTWNGERMRLLRSRMTSLGLTQVQFAREHDRRLKRFLWSDPLDHVFYRGLAVRSGSARVLHTLKSSDHVPMVVEFYVLA